MIEFDYGTYSNTHFFTRFCLVTILIFAVIGAFFLFSSPFDVENLIVTGYVLLSCLLIYGIVALLKWLSVFIHKKCEAKKSTQMRNEILIGLGAIFFGVVVPIILVFFVTPVDDFTIYSLILFPVYIAVYYLFVYESDRNYEWDSPSDGDDSFRTSMASQFVAQILITTIVLSCDFDSKTAKSIIAHLFTFGMFCAPTTSDLYGILSGKRELKDVDEEEEAARNTGNVRSQSVRKEKTEVLRFECEDCKNREFQMAQSHPKINCKICLLEYSDVLIPRILNGCGHTICETCADTLLNPNQRHFLLCPFCKTRTAVNGPARMLQKNYGILEILNDLKN